MGPDPCPPPQEVRPLAGALEPFLGFKALAMQPSWPRPSLVIQALAIGVFGLNRLQRMLFVAIDG